MQCCKVSINKNYKCDKAACVCIPTNGKSCICICENENGDIMRCDDCKCYSDTCQCKCDDSKCTCIVTNGASCVCVCRDERGNIKTCDCSCVESDERKSCCKKELVKSCECSSKKLEEDTSGTLCKCDGKKNFQVFSRDASTSKSYKCNKAGCICIPTGGKPCVCICENEYGDITRCDDCKCYSDTCQCKCDDSRCTCIVTNGASCICVCRDERGNFKTCNCSCTEFNQEKSCCKNELAVKCCECCNNDGKRNLQVQRRNVSFRNNNECNQVGCVCIPTRGKPSICVCENEKREIVRCDDCKCVNSKCTCILANGVSCICVCRDERGNLKTCDCSCIESEKAKPCCEKALPVKSGKCCSKNPEKSTSRKRCGCNEAKKFQVVPQEVNRKSYKCNKAGCICIPTDGKPCICICENENGDIIRCDDCKCYPGNCQCKCDDPRCTCIVTNGASCICMCRDERGNFKVCDCSCIEFDEIKPCCKKVLPVDSGKCCSKNLERSISSNRCNCDGTKKFQLVARDVANRKSYKCNKAGCICIPTDGKPCICICENENGDIVRCDDCKCYPGNCQCKCDDPRCTCIVTNGASCICVCRDERGNFKVCDCSCTEFDEVKPCCKKEFPAKSSGCCSNVANSRDYQTREKPCVCICENERGDLVYCDDCKCDDNRNCDKEGCVCISEIKNRGGCYDRPTNIRITNRTPVCCERNDFKCCDRSNQNRTPQRNDACSCRFKETKSATCMSNFKQNSCISDDRRANIKCCGANRFASNDRQLVYRDASNREGNRSYINPKGNSCIRENAGNVTMCRNCN